MPTKTPSSAKATASRRRGSITARVIDPVPESSAWPFAFRLPAADRTKDPGVDTAHHAAGFAGVLKLRRFHRPRRSTDGIDRHQPRSRHSPRWGRSAPSVESLP
ncbi:hypothetical protein GS506_13030 [Rhodococcus hoagii]|nr:hypothetical protein [Prescottella equi]